MSGFSDPYSQMLGTDSPYDQAALDYYGNMPQLRSPYLATSNYNPQDEFRQRVQNAYESDIVRRIQSVDPDADDYEIQVSELFANIPDENAANYPRVATALQAATGRRKIYQQKKEQALESQIGLAKLGMSPDQIAQIRDESGNFDPVRAAFKEFQLKKGIGKEAMPLSEKERETVLPLVTQLRQGLFSDDEKAMAVAKAKQVNIDPELDPEGWEGFKEGLSVDDWTQGDALARQDVVGKTTALIDVLKATGRDTRGLEELIKPVSAPIDPWAATRSPSPTDQAPAVPGAPNQPAPPAPKSDGFNDPADPNLTMLEADKARQQAEATAKESQQKQSTNDQWTSGKQALEQRLLGVFENDPNKLRQFYNSVKKNEFTSSGDGVNAPMMADNLANSILTKVGLDPDEVSGDIPLDRGFFGGGKVSNLDLLKALADDRLGQSATQPNEVKTKSGNVARPSSK